MQENTNPNRNCNDLCNILMSCISCTQMKLNGPAYAERAHYSHPSTLWLNRPWLTKITHTSKDLFSSKDTPTLNSTEKITVIPVSNIEPTYNLMAILQIPKIFILPRGLTKKGINCLMMAKNIWSGLLTDSWQKWCTYKFYLPGN